MPHAFAPDLQAVTRHLFGAMFTCVCLLNSAVAQDIGAVPLYGTANLDVYFTPDPHTVQVVAGGSDSVDQLGDNCVGYITASQPDYDLNYAAGGAPLGVFVDGAVDTTLLINDPAGNWHCSDDSSFLSNANPGLGFDDPLPGLYNIWVGTYDNVGADTEVTLVITEYGEEAWATLDLSSSTGGDLAGIDFGDDTSTWANDGECDDPRFEGDGMAATLIATDRFHDASDCSALFSAGSIRLVAQGQAPVDDDLLRGRLESGDARRANDSYADEYNFSGNAGETAIIDLRSGDFDTFLTVRSPSGQEFSNDDYESSFDRSLLSLNLTENGTYAVEVSSYSAGESGGYTLEINTEQISDLGTQRYTGSLAAGDTTIDDSGEYVDSYSFEGRPGMPVSIELQSNDFDAYLILRSPGGEVEFNDDSDGATDSRIETELTELGNYSVFVTSFTAGESGDYSLNIDAGTEQSTAAASSRDTMPLALGESIQGSLASGDALSDSDGFQDSYVFEANSGDAITVDMSSSDFDTYLTLVTPAGEMIENDDYQGSISQSQVQLNIRENGRYRIVASSYAGGETGSYRLSLARGGSSAAVAPVSSSGEQIFGIFAGVADYPGVDNDLPLTDQDAVRARDALINGAGMNPDNAFTLLNSDATLANLRNSLDQINALAGPEDTLVLFYSGHGSRQPRPDGPDSRDPDGMDETMVLYDTELIDDDLAAMLDELDVGKVLLVMDACFSGGFSKDIVARPGRMGLFSSEEDVLSQVALKFQAGGYLSVFFEEALTQPYADRDEDGELTAIELSQYLHDRFRSDVKSFGTDEYVRASGPQANYQQLVVDRGGIGPYNVLFTRQ